MRSNDAHIWTWTSPYIDNVVIPSNPAVNHHTKMFVVTNSLNGAPAVWESIKEWYFEQHPEGPA